tara:strand:- start:1202 stop:1882 length:681 start_codon:yes stop_codon:yes gene_type:complete
MPLTRPKKVPTANLAQGSSFLTTASTLTSDNMPAGSILQTLNYHSQTSGVISATGAYKWMEVELVTKRANSDFDVTVVCTWSAPNESNRDNQNRGVDFGYKTGSASSTVGDYTAIGGRSGSGSADYQGTGMGGSGAGSYPMWNTDVIYGQGPNNGGSSGYWGSDYEPANFTQKFKIDLSIAAGTTIQFAVWTHLDNTSTLNGVHYDIDGTDYNGATSSLTVAEIAV